MQGASILARKLRSWRNGSTASWRASRPAWQRELDQQAEAKKAQQEFQQRWGPVFDLGFLSLAGLLLIGGPVLLYLWWYRKGRDHPVGLIADYLPEPPSDLPAGMVGTLIDESADMQDILATVLDLARRGALEIEETQEPGFLGIGTNSDFIYRRKSGFSETLRPYEDTLLDNMFKSGKKVKLSDLKNKFYTAVPTIRKQLYEAVVSEGYLASNPETVRSTYGCLGVAALVAAIVVRLLLRRRTGAVSRGSRCACRWALAVIAIGLIILARYMPRRTEERLGSRWRAGGRSSAICRTWRSTPRSRRPRRSSSAICPMRWRSGWSRASSASSRRWMRRRRPGGSPTACRGRITAAVGVQRRERTRARPRRTDAERGRLSALS